MRRVLLLEFNELSPTLVDRFIAAGELPAFERLRARSARFITEAGETGARLNPWVQWVTVHTGVTAEEHGVGKLGEGPRLQLPTIADGVNAAGGSVWVCGSMNVHPMGPVRGGVLPDPWSVAGPPQPLDLQPYHRFVQANVQEHTAAAKPLSRADTRAFVRFMATHGLSASTGAASLSQLIRELTDRGRSRWRRAELLDRFQWDVFTHYYRRLRPTLATFFSNSTAHLQHLYWNELDDDATRSKVLDGYRQMDRLVAQAIALAGDTATVALCTGLSQVANGDSRNRSGFYRPRDFTALNDAFGVAGVTGVAPLMAEQWHVFFGDVDAAGAGAAAFASVRSGGEPVFSAEQRGSGVLVGCRFFTPRPLEAPLDRLLYWSDAPREGTHHPDGIFWVGTGPRARVDVRVPLTAVAPTLLDLVGADLPASMRGESLLAGV